MPPLETESEAVSSALEAGASLVEARGTLGHPSYVQILKSSMLIGGASMVNIGLGIVRTKAMAVWLGPAGVGLMGLYGSVADVAQSIAGMGVSSSGVRQIAEAVGAGEPQRVARIVAVVRWLAAFLGIFGAGLLVVFSKQVSMLTFGTDQRAGSVCLLSTAVFFTLAGGGQAAILQGMRRISDLARTSVFGALWGAIAGILLVYFLRTEGVVPALIAAAAMSSATSWWYARKIGTPVAPMTAAQVRSESAALLKLGVAFMASGFLMMGSACAIRTMVVRQVGLEAAGLYQSAWVLGGLYVGFILQAMGADFYPRLTAVSSDNLECNRLVNEQARVSLLLAGPGVIGTLTFAPAVVSLFYSSRFGGAIEILRWICLGMSLRAVTWPMGFIILAKGRRRPFLFSEAAWAVVHVGLAQVLLRKFGLTGAGIAFFGSYVFHGCIIYPIVRNLSRFRWSAENKRSAMLFLPMIALTFCGFHWLKPNAAIAIGTAAFAVAGTYSGRILLKLLRHSQEGGELE